MMLRLSIAVFAALLLLPGAVAAQDTAPATTIEDGVWPVGTKIAPGMYRTEGAEGCQWARLASLDREIAHGDPVGAAIVRIEGTDFALFSP